MDGVQVARGQYRVYALLCLLIFVMVVFALPSTRLDFQRYFGALNPLLVVTLAAVGGGVALRWLSIRWGFQIIAGRATLQGMAISLGLATLLAGAIVVADFIIRYPESLNVPLPAALLFYPTIGFVAEIVFHIAPLTVSLLTLAQFDNYVTPNRAVWLAIFFASAVEPMFQVIFPGEPLSWGAVYTGVHVYIISLFQLLVFRRFDFVSMYAFRLLYYVYWHIIWGTWRLDILF